MSAQYIYYKFDQNSSTITNHGTGLSAYNGQAARAQYAKDTVGYPVWGPLNSNKDGIVVPGGISSPYQHTWQFGINISQWWPVNGVIDSTLVGNDGKLWSAANDLYYGYIHEQCSWDGSSNCPPTGGGLIQEGIYYFSIEIQQASYLNAQFWLGVEGNKPTQIHGTPGGESNQSLYVTFDGYALKLNTNYYFQVSVDAGGPTGGEYCIGNCIQMGAGCNDASNCGGFPCGCYIYSWREDNTVLNLSGGGNWADDVVLWKGGTPPTPGPYTPPGPPLDTASGLCKLTANIRVQEYQPKTI
jgi:hypothetical protein